MLDNAWEYHLCDCPVCGGTLLPSDEAPKTIQQIEIIQKPIRIDEHRGLAYGCESCEKVHYAPLPPEVQKGGLFGPELTRVQFCIAHLIRGVKFLMTLPDRRTQIGASLVRTDLDNACHL